MRIIKLFFASAFMLLLINTADAQIFVGGGFKFSTEMPRSTVGSTTTDGIRTTTFYIAPSVGYFIKENIAVGASIGYSMYREREDDGTEVIETTNLFALSPFARYYAFKIGGISIFAQGTLSLGFGSENTKVDGTKTDGPSLFAFGFDVAPAIAYDLGEKLTLEARFGGLSFSHVKSSQEVAGRDMGNSKNTWDFGADLTSITFGVTYKL